MNESNTYHSPDAFLGHDHLVVRLRYQSDANFAARSFAISHMA